MRMRIGLLVLCLGWLPTAVHANVKPHTLCSEGMVLQQKSTAKVWGTANTDEKVTVTFRDKTSSTVADGKGNWVVMIETGAAGGPFAMTIAGGNTITYKNILVGEVWVCSGQSNMEWKVSGCDKSDKEFASAAPHNPMLRTFNVTKSPQAEPQSEFFQPPVKEPKEGGKKILPVYGRWMDAAPETVNDFTATGYFFGRNLQETLKVPVGLIHTSWGGTRIETWMSQAALEAAGVKEGPSPKGVGANTASALYNGMLHPLLNYTVKGAVWYQGESNAGNAFKYRTLHPGMIKSWRNEFKNPDLAFYFVQLAPYGSVNAKPGESNWAELREAQTMTLALKGTGQAVITDFGDEGDIHPTPKRPVGERLALAARANTYGEKIVYSGPLYKGVKIEGAKATLLFDHVGGGLVGKEMIQTKERKNKAGVTLAAWRVKETSSNATLVGFTMCGKDKVFHPASAEISGDTVVVISGQVAEPIAVRYGWANHPVCNLFNRNGLPASPFRTDSFPGITQPKQ